jgi:hypothetical protein
MRGAVGALGKLLAVGRCSDSLRRRPFGTAPVSRKAAFGERLSHVSLTFGRRSATVAIKR